MFQEDLFKQKSVLITGGGTGIGRALALEFARHGAQVGIIGRREEPLQGTCKLVDDAGFEGACTYKTLDIREEEDAREVVQSFWDQWGRIDILINNAGGNFVAPAHAMSTKGFRSVIEINLIGTFTMSRLVAELQLADGQGGRIINMSATNAHNGSPMMVHSGASKAGINSMTETLAVEWGAAGITVNAILPGPVRTEGSDERLWTDEETVNKLEARIPRGRFARPDDITGAALFLASPQASLITGAMLVIDGGDRLRVPPFV